MKRVLMFVVVLVIAAIVLMINREEKFSVIEPPAWDGRLIQWNDPSHVPDQDALWSLMPEGRDKIYVHMIYLPWDKTGRLKSDEFAFDQTFARKFSDTVRKQNPNFVVKMWTRSELERFSELWCPGLWSALLAKTSTEKNHPVMIVDLYRWLVVYVYGGIYWQYQSNLLGQITDFLPSDSRQTVKLFTETILTPAECVQNGKVYKIRNGEPEEPLRIYTSIFFATPEHPFVALMLDEIVRRLNQYDAHENYDILYITGNAVLPTVYDRSPQFRDAIELVSMEDRDKLISMSSHATWRR